MSRKIVIVGSGLAGYSVAREIRDRNPDTPITLITADQGDFYSKPLLSNALAQQKAAADLVITPAAKMREKLNIELFTHTTVLNIDRENRFLETSAGSMSYDYLVLAVGAVKNALPVDLGISSQSVNDLEEYTKFREWLKDKQRLLVVGSGLVGCEFTNDLGASGHKLTVVSNDTYPLAQWLPEVVGHALGSAFEQQGVHFYWRQTLDTIWPSLSSEVDGVFVATGLKPNIELAHKAQLAVNRGIQVDAFLRTSDPFIYALGDCAEVCGQVKMYIQPLLLSARALARNLMGEDPAPLVYPLMPIVVKTPWFPIIVLAPEAREGEWQIEGSGLNWQALFYSPAGILKGFCLSGSYLKHKNDWLKQVVQE